jgi:ankyrin repeat protein
MCENRFLFFDKNKLQTQINSDAFFQMLEEGNLCGLREFYSVVGSFLGLRNHRGETPVHIACRQNNVEMLKILIEEGDAINQLESRLPRHGFTPLFVAASLGNLVIVKYLLEEFQVHVEREDYCGFNVLTTAIYNGQLEVVQYLTENYPTMLAGVSRDLEMVIEFNELEIAQYLVKINRHVGLNSFHFRRVRFQENETARFLYRILPEEKKKDFSPIFQRKFRNYDLALTFSQLDCLPEKSSFFFRYF